MTAHALPARLEAYPWCWQGRRRPTSQSEPTGHPALDRVLPGGGWPAGALTELLAARPGLGEFDLLMPLLARITSNGGWLILVDPPWVPYPPAMYGHGIDLSRLLLVRGGGGRQALWACEQALRGVRGGTVLAWPEVGRARPGFTELRRLQLAARAGRKTAFLLRPASVAGNASPAALRLLLETGGNDLRVRVLKCRGARPRDAIGVRRAYRWPDPATPARSAGDGPPDVALVRPLAEAVPCSPLRVS